MNGLQNIFGNLRQYGQRLQAYFVMPATNQPSLPQIWLSYTGLSSWLLASLITGLAPYLVLGLFSFLSNTQNWIVIEQWRYALVYPIASVYLLLLIPYFRHHLARTVQAYLPLIPNVHNSEQYMAEVYLFKRKREWLALGLGALAGLIITPFEDLVGFWQICYVLVGQAVTIGLAGWVTYSVVIGTRTLTSLYNQTQGMNIPRRGMLPPLGRWTLSIVLALVIGGLLTSLILSNRDFFSVRTLIVYSAIALFILLVLLRDAGSSSLLAQFRIIRAFTLFLLVALIGTLGYQYLEEWTPLEGLYMTVITMTTIGYGETNPLGQSGRVFTIFLSLISVGIAGYALSAVAAFLFEGDFQRALGRQKMNKQIANFKDHIILCGAGYIGEQIASEFFKTHTTFVVVDDDQSAIEAILRAADTPYIVGNATKDETLILCGIDRARGLIANLSDDKDNAFVVLSARALNQNLRIVARLTDNENAEKLRKVGADEIVSPGAIGGLRMASVMIRPVVVNFLDEMMRSSGQTLRLEEAVIHASSSLANVSLAQANVGKKTGVLVVAIRSENGEYQFNPQSDTILEPSHTLIVIGTPQQMASLHELSAA